MNGPLAPFRATPHGVPGYGMRGGAGPTALLIHGVAGSWRNFRPWLQRGLMHGWTDEAITQQRPVLARFLDDVLADT